MLYDYTLFTYQKESGVFQDSAIRFAFDQSRTYLIDEIFVPCNEGFIVAMKSSGKTATAWLCHLTKEGTLIQLDALGIGIDAYLVGRDEKTITILTKDSSKELALHRYALHQQ